MVDLHEQFHYNIMLAKALVQLMPELDRQYMRIWFDYLLELEPNDENMVMKNEYVWFILLMLQNNKIEEFFKGLPPRVLVPLRKAIPVKVIDEVLLSSDKNLSWLENVSTEEKEQQLNKKKVHPEDFVYKQPCPKEGIICYFGAFSDQSM